jgi:hypothetical protein
MKFIDIRVDWVESTPDLAFFRPDMLESNSHRVKNKTTRFDFPFTWPPWREAGSVGRMHEELAKIIN